MIFTQLRLSWILRHESCACAIRQSPMCDRAHVLQMVVNRQSCERDLMPRPSSFGVVRCGVLGIAAFLFGAAGAGAQTTVTLADTSQTTTLTATVGDQARV